MKAKSTATWQLGGLPKIWEICSTVILSELFPPFICIFRCMFFQGDDWNDFDSFWPREALGEEAANINSESISKRGKFSLTQFWKGQADTEMVDGLRTTASLNGSFLLQDVLFPWGWVCERNLSLRVFAGERWRNPCELMVCLLNSSPISTSFSNCSVTHWDKLLYALCKHAVKKGEDSLQLNIFEPVSESITVKENKALFTGLCCHP